MAIPEMNNRAPALVRSRWLHAAGAAVIILLTLLAYWPAIHGSFIWDDDEYVINNPLLNDAVRGGLSTIWLQPSASPQYYPAVFTSFWIERQLWQLNPMGYHIVNVLLHALNALLVWRLCNRINLGIRPIGSWLIAAVFALHPVHVESVAWITERKNVLSGCFYLLAMLSYLRFDDDSSPRGSEAGRRWAWYALALGLFVLALLSKSVTCSLPAALILIMLQQRKQLSLARLWPLAPMFLIGLALAINTALLEKDHVLATGPDFAFTFAQRVVIASKALLFYPAKLLWPYPLIFVYPRWTIDASNIANFWPAAVVVVIALTALIFYRRGVRGPALALAFFAGTVLPALGFVNIYPMIFSFVADHFQYLASLGTIVLVIGGISHRLNDSNRIAALGVIVLPILLALTWNQSRVYLTLETLWLDTLQKNEKAWLAHTNIVPILLQQSDYEASNKRPDRAQKLSDEALLHAAEAVRLKPDHCPALSNLSEVLRTKGMYQEAIEPLMKVIDRYPKEATYRFQLGQIYDSMKRSYEATEAFRKAVELEPGSILYRSFLARTQVRRGERVAAGEQLQAILLLVDDAAHPAAPIDALALDSLAATFSIDGLSNEATRAADAALAIAHRLSMTDLAQAIEHRRMLPPVSHQ